MTEKSFSGWLVAEAVETNYLEYWHNGEPVLQLTGNDDIEPLEKLKLLLNDAKIKPCDLG